VKSVGVDYRYTKKDNPQFTILYVVVSDTWRQLFILLMLVELLAITV